MECYQQVRLEIADGDVYPGKPFVHPFRRSHTAFMLLGLSQDPQCHQSIRAVGYYYIVYKSPKIAESCSYGRSFSTTTPELQRVFQDGAACVPRASALISRLCLST